MSVYPRSRHSLTLCGVCAGIVVGIDPTTCMFHVATPVEPAVLSRVNCFMRGAMSLPAMFIHQGNVVADRYVASNLLTGFGTGGARMQSRNTIKRTRLGN